MLQWVLSPVRHLPPLLQSGVVKPGKDASAGPRKRRKQLREQAEGGDAEALLGGVQWANPAAHRRAFRCCTGWDCLALAGSVLI